MAGSQFFDIDWSLLAPKASVSATNSLGLERLAGISPQYLSMLTASVSYLAHSPLLPEAQRTQAASLYQRLRQLVKPGETPWLSLTGYELEPHCFSVSSSRDLHRIAARHGIHGRRGTDPPQGRRPLQDLRG